MKNLKLILIALLINSVAVAQIVWDDISSSDKASTFYGIATGKDKVPENTEINNIFEKVISGNEKILLVADWTGSMYSYTPAVLNYFRIHSGGIKYLALFNDGDGKPDGKIGESYGVHYVNNPSNLSSIIKVADETKKAGGGGDGPENDVEAIWRSIKHFSSGTKWESRYGGEIFVKKKSGGITKIVLVADGSSQVKDMSELHKVKYPVHVIFCKKSGSYASDYLEIAYQTGGTVVSESSIADFTSSKKTTVTFNDKTYKRSSGGKWL